jgi:hypothetical protein
MAPVEVEFWEEPPQLRSQDSRSFRDSAFELHFGASALGDSPWLTDAGVFVLRLDAGGSHIGMVPQYAPILGRVMERLMSDEFVVCLQADAGMRLSWYESDGKPADAWVRLSNWLIHYQPMRESRHFYLMRHQPSQLLFVEPSFFLECSRDSVSSLFRRYWAVFDTNEFWGYVLPAGSVPLLLGWNVRELSADLVNEIMGTAFVTFRSIFDNSAVVFATSRLDFEGFRQRIRLDALLRLVARMDAAELSPYWQLLWKIDQFARRQKIDRLGDLRTDLDKLLEGIGKQDPEWLRQFRDVWARLEQICRRPVPKRRDMVQVLDLEPMFAAWDEVRELIWVKLPR